MKNFTIIVILFALIAAGCASGKKAFKKGDFDLAVQQSVKRLQSKPGNRKAQITLENAYNYAIQFRTENIKQLENSNDPLALEKMINNYRSMDQLGQMIRRCPSCRDIISNPVSYSNEISKISESAAETRYIMGLEALRFKTDRKRAKEAHLHFLRALDLVPNYKDSRMKAEESLEFAILRVVIEPIPSSSRQMAIRHEYFYNKLQEYFMRNPVNPYVRFISPEEVRTQGVDWVDHVVKMEFQDFSLGNVINNTVIEDVSRDSVVIAKKGDEDIYGTVKAKFKLYEKSITGFGLLDFQILDVELNRVISQEKFPGQYIWTARWATFTGDERALSKEQKELIKRSEVSIPLPQYMFEEFAAPIYDQVMRKLTYYYRNY